MLILQLSVRKPVVFRTHSLDSDRIFCKFPSVSTPGGKKHVCLKAFVCRVVFCRGSSRGACVGPPTAFLRGGTTGVPWVSLPGPTSVAKRQTLCVLVGVVTSCVLCARVRGRVSRLCATENTYNPARLETLFKLSVVTFHRHLYRSLQHFCGLWVLCPTRHLVRDLIEIFLLVVGGVAIRLVQANANLFRSR